MTEIVDLIHRVRDGLLVAAMSLERGDELEAAEQIKRTLTDARARLEKLKAAA